jgi:hypothetical protein
MAENRQVIESRTYWQNVAGVWIPVTAANPMPVTAGGVTTLLTPIERAVEHNVAVVAAVDILGAAIAPINTPCLFRVAVGFDAAGVFSVTIIRGGNTQVQQLNHGVALVPNCLFMFDVLVHENDTINYRYSVNATLQTLRLQEIPAGTQ